MNVPEGARRMKLAGLWIASIPLGILLLLMVGAGTLIVQRQDYAYLANLGPAAILILLYLEIPGWILWLAGWIVEGFSQEEKP